MAALSLLDGYKINVIYFYQKACVGGPYYNMAHYILNSLHFLIQYELTLFFALVHDILLYAMNTCVKITMSKNRDITENN